MFSLKPDRPDKRDYVYTRKLEALPTYVDLRSKCSRIEDQGPLGSCTANALVGNLEFLEKKDGTTYTDLSRLFVYYNERVVEKTEHEDSGATLRDGIKVLKDFGVCSEKLWPYNESFLFLKPTPVAYEEAGHHKISKYERLNTLDEMRDCLAQGYPFVFGVKVFASIESDVVRRSGYIPLPKTGEQLLGGHALLAVGYDQDEELLIIRNSWGKGWGKGGYGWLPYSYFFKGLAMDAWTVMRRV